jgi:hypothetical protein
MVITTSTIIIIIMFHLLLSEAQGRSEGWPPGCLLLRFLLQPSFYSLVSINLALPVTMLF